jgi:hypothetical protein
MSVFLIDVAYAIKISCGENHFASSSVVL